MLDFVNPPFRSSRIIIFGEFSNEIILPFIQNKGHRTLRRVTLRGITFSAASDTVDCVKRNQTCSECGVTGNVWVVLKNNDEKTMEIPSLHLFHKTHNNKYVLMTKDHLVPRSLGGKDSRTNYQTMCTLCNRKKDKLLPEKLPEDYRAVINSLSFKSMNDFIVRQRVQHSNWGLTTTLGGLTIRL